MLRLGATPVCRRSSGTCATPARIAARGSPPAQAPAVDLDGAGRMAPEAGQHLRQLPLAVARHAGDADHLAGPDGERDVAERVDPAVAAGGERTGLEHDVADLGGLAPASQLDVPAHHQRRELAARHVGGADGRDRAPAAEDGDAVGDGRHLVELVGDEDDRAVLRRHRPERREETLRLLRRQHRRRLVEDQDPRLAVERLEDLHPLLLADGELPDLRPRVDRQPEAVAELGDRALDAPPMEQERAADVAVVAEDDVLRDGERLDEPEVLVHHPDPRVERVARRRQRDGPAVQLELALVGVVQARQDVRERALPGAVLAEQRVHLADRHLEVDGVVRDHAGEALRDPAHRNRRRIGRSLVELVVHLVAMSFPRPRSGRLQGSARRRRESSGGIPPGGIPLAD